MKDSRRKIFRYIPDPSLTLNQLIQREKKLAILREDKSSLKDYKKSFPGNYGSMLDFVKSYEFQEYDFRHKLIKSTVES